MGYCTEPNVRIEFVGNCLNFKSETYVKMGDEKYKITPRTSVRFKCCTNLKEYVESIEYFAFLVLVRKDIPNDGWFEKWCE